MKLFIPVVSMMARGIVQCAKVDGKTGCVLLWYPSQPNLIMNAGMNRMATGPTNAEGWEELWRSCQAGIGTTPTFDSGGATTAAQSGTTVTLTGGSFTFTDTATDAGKMIKWGTSEEARILTVTDVTHAEVTPSQSVSAGSFTVYRTTQTVLATPVKTYVSYLTGTGNCDSSVTGNVATLKRTYDFSIEVGNVTYTEVGFFSVSGSALFSRVVLAAPVSLVVGQALRVVYTLNVTVEPDTGQTVTAPGPITNLSTSGTKQLTGVGFCGINTSGNSLSTTPWGSFNTPNSQNVGFISPSSAAINAFNTTQPDRTTNSTAIASVPQTYTLLNFFRDRHVVYGANDANRSDLRSLGIGTGGTNISSGTGFVYLTDASMAKDNLHTLTIVYRISWGRVLS